MLYRRFLALAFCLLVFPAQAGSIDHTNITASTTLTPRASIAPGVWGVEELVDGSIFDGYPYFGFVSAATSGTVSLQLDDVYDVESFELWNDVNVGNEGVRNFHLDFFDAAGDLIGATSTFTAISIFGPQTFSFATVSGVQSVDFVIETVSGQIEVREVNFNGQLTAVPGPIGVLVMLAGLVGLMRSKR